MIIHCRSFKEKNWDLLKKQYTRNKVALTFLSNFESDDVAAVELGANSTALWIISPPDLDRLREELNSSKHGHDFVLFKLLVTCFWFLITANPVQVRYKYTISRTTYSDKMVGTISAEEKYDLKPLDPERTGLIEMLNETHNLTYSSVTLKNLFPKFLKVRRHFCNFEHVYLKTKMNCNVKTIGFGSRLA